MFLFLHHLNDIIWGAPMIVLLLGTHLFFTIYLKGIQRHIFSGIRYSITPERGAKGASGFPALAAMLAATLGTGNIIGISTAVAAGGPGAIFWCLITGILGIATSYAECFLSLSNRLPSKSPSGKTTRFHGGPMYVLAAIGKKKMAAFYACAIIFTSFGVGVTTQINAVSSTLLEFYRLPPWIPGITGAVLVSLVIVKGSTHIQKVCTKLVPAMSLFYIIGCVFILYLNRSFLLDATLLILKQAWSVKAAGSGFLGGSMMLALRYGVARGLYTSEAGLGSSAIAAAAADTDNPVRQSLISMTASFWDTIVMCTITGLVIITNLMAHPSNSSYSDGSLTTAAFLSIPHIGVPMLVISLCAFALATMIGWYAFGEQAVRFLKPESAHAVPFYQFSYLIMAFAGAILSLEAVWEFADFFNALLVLPNLYVLYALKKTIQTP